MTARSSRRSTHLASTITSWSSGSIATSSAADPAAHCNRECPDASRPPKPAGSRQQCLREVTRRRGRGTKPLLSLEDLTISMRKTGFWPTLHSAGRSPLHQLTSILATGSAGVSCRERYPVARPEWRRNDERRATSIVVRRTPPLAGFLTPSRRRSRLWRHRAPVMKAALNCVPSPRVLHG